MKVYNSFGEMFEARSGSCLCVLNRTSGSCSTIYSSPLFEEYIKDYMPERGYGSNQLEQILVGVNKLWYQYHNDGDYLNRTEDYRIRNDAEAKNDFFNWIVSDGDRDVVNEFLEMYGYDVVGSESSLGDQFYISSARQLRNDYSALIDYVKNYSGYDKVGNDSRLTHDNENDAWLDTYAELVESADPNTGRYISAMRSANSDREYSLALNALIRFVTQNLPKYEGNINGWKFRNIPKDEVSSWFK